MMTLTLHKGVWMRPISVLHALAQKSVAWAQAARKRRDFKTLLDLDDRMLADMGVHRYEVETAARLPLSTDAATQLHRVSLERRARMM